MINLTKSQSFILFTFICFEDFKFVEPTNFFNVYFAAPSYAPLYEGVRRFRWRIPLPAGHTDLVQQLTGNAASTEIQTLFSHFQ
jgi:hypothetical protein